MRGDLKTFEPTVQKNTLCQTEGHRTESDCAAAACKGWVPDTLPPIVLTRGHYSCVSNPVPFLSTLKKHNITEYSVSLVAGAWPTEIFPTL